MKYAKFINSQQIEFAPKNKITEDSTDTHLPYKLSTSKVNTGLFGVQSAQSNSTNTPTNESQMWVNGAFLFPNINVYAVRHWNRVLSPAEIKANYDNDKARFNF